MKKSLLSSIVAGAAVAALALAPNTAAAQNATISATATVLTPLTVTAGNDLAFGTVYPGVPASVLPTAATAGSFSISGVASAGLTVQFTLPANLIDAASDNLPITFGTADAAYNQANSQSGTTAFDPNSPVTAALSGTGNFYVWIGGTVAAAGNQPAGSYTGTITLTAAYTGS
ncbi:MAG TPA: DUF4402 domain-containing protein [Gemmatimonadales bacterium]|nr:DUF4402 domain-containing protein [Gemmatimonadales bacterium]